ncbi:hypothetical protein ACJW30_07G032700 [Castanea mollissima]
MGLHLLLLVLLVAAASASSNTSKIVTTLPGYTGELPFTLETRYIGVGDNETVQLFYYFVESQRSSSRDPLVLWMSGGPGCSGLAGIFFESGNEARIVPINLKGGMCFRTQRQIHSLTQIQESLMLIVCLSYQINSTREFDV